MSDDDTLKTLEKKPETNGKTVTVPDCRMKDASATQDFVRRLRQNDEKRSYKRARVDGLVGGNPPYRRSSLLKANRAEAANVNFGVARAYMENGCGSFYDLATEAPGHFGIRTAHGLPEQKEQWSHILMEESDRVITTDDAWDYEVQLSIDDMVLHGCGPLMFEDAYKVLPRAFRCSDLLVPEFTKSDTKYWEACCVTVPYYPPELYDFIRKADVAKQVGWDVPYTRQVISGAMNVKAQDGRMYDWEWYQQELKNNSYTYYDESKVCRVAHVFWKEFDGRITHGIVEENTSTSEPVKYLFIRIGRYSSWQRAIHPMYFDRGGGGYHHSVTGLGVKMYAAMEYQNRLLCNLADKAFAPKILFKPTTAEATQQFSMKMMGDYAVLNSNWEWSQTGVAGLMNEGLAMNKEIQELMQSNLSSYRQQAPMKQEGNPLTAKQVMYDANQQSSLAKTTYNRFYKQRDLLLTEIVRRLCLPNSTDDRAVEFQDRCKKRGVPPECFGRIERVESIRVIGQGSAFLRKQAVSELLPILGRLPENGQDNLVNDFIASGAGQSAVARYNPTTVASKMPTDQKAEAVQWVAAMKVGVPPVVTASQHAVTYAQTFMEASVAAVNSVQQGADIAGVLQFLDLAGPAISAHIKRFANDPTRKTLAGQLEEQWKKLAQITDKLKARLEQQHKAQQGAQKQQMEAQSDGNIKMLKARNDIQIKIAKTKAQLAQSAQKHAQKLAQTRQSMILEDAKTASEIHRDRIKASKKDPD